MSSWHRLLPRMNTSSAVDVAMDVLGFSGTGFMSACSSAIGPVIRAQPLLQLVTLHLARGAARQLGEVDEAYLLGLLGAGELGAAQAEEILGGQRRALGVRAARDERDGN